MMKRELLIVLLSAIVFGGGGFFAGTKYQPAKTGINRINNAGFIGQNGQRQFINRNGSRPVSGEVINIDANSMTVKMQDGSSKLIILSPSTKYVRTAETTAGEIKTGAQVGIFGTTNPDGSVTAVNVQINPQFNIRTGISGTPQP